MRNWSSSGIIYGVPDPSPSPDHTMSPTWDLSLLRRLNLHTNSQPMPVLVCGRAGLLLARGARWSRSCPPPSVTSATGSAAAAAVTALLARPGPARRPGASQTHPAPPPPPLGFIDLQTQRSRAARLRGTWGTRGPCLINRAGAQLLLYLNLDITPRNNRNNSASELQW